jgi:hypothetical protein
MPLQSGRAVSVRYKVQAGLGTAASGSGGKELPFAPSAGFTLSKAAIEDPTVRADGMRLRPRHGSRSVSGSYDVTARVSALNEPIEAVLRGTWVATDTLDQTDFTSLTTPTANTIVAATGNLITLGVRKGMVIQLTGMTATANNSRNLTVTNVTATTITVAETLTVDAVADTSCSIILPRYVTNGVPPVDRYFTIEEYFQDIDASEVATDAVWSSMEVTLAPDQTANVSLGIVARDVTTAAGASAPVFTSPTTYARAAFVSTDAKLIVNGTPRVNLTGFSLSWDIAAATVPVVGSTISPDVFKNQGTLSGSVSALREDLTLFDLFDDETEVALAFTLVEPTAEPKKFLSFYVPLATLNGNDAPLGGDNAMVETIQWTAGLASATGDVPGMLLVCTSDV